MDFLNSFTTDFRLCPLLELTSMPLDPVSRALLDHAFSTALNKLNNQAVELFTIRTYFTILSFAGRLFVLDSTQCMHLFPD